MPANILPPAPTPPSYVSPMRQKRHRGTLQSTFSQGYSEIQGNWLFSSTVSTTEQFFDGGVKLPPPVDTAASELDAELAEDPIALEQNDVLVYLSASLTKSLLGFGRDESLAANISRGWLRTAIKKLDQFGRLPLNWDSYGAEPPNTVVRKRAEDALRVLYRLNSEPSRLAASAEGGITISFFQGKKYGDIEFFNSGEILALTSDRTGTPEVWAVTSDDVALANVLERIRDFVRAK